MDFNQAELVKASQTSAEDPNTTMANAKVAAVCELSWINAGWTVNRIKSFNDLKWKTPLELIVHADVFNRSFFRSTYHLSEPSTLCVDGSTAAMLLNQTCVELLQTITNGAIWKINPGWTERKICEFLDLEFENFMALAFTDPHWPRASLIHFTRSSMQWFQPETTSIDLPPQYPI